jgi:hypothetical protein
MQMVFTPLYLLWLITCKLIYDGLWIYDKTLRHVSPLNEPVGGADLGMTQSPAAADQRHLSN